MTRRRSILLFVAVLPLMGVLFPVAKGVEAATKTRMVQLATGAHGSVPPEIEYVALLSLQAVLCYAALVVLVVAILRTSRHHVRVAFSTSAASIAQAVAAGAAIGACTSAALVWLEAVPAPMVYRGFVGAPSLWALLIVNIAAAVASAGEELYFRGLLYSLSRGFLGSRVAMSLNVTLFMAWHTWAYQSLTQLVVVAIIGIACVVMVERKRSITPAIICHTVVNVLNYDLVFLTSH